MIWGQKLNKYILKFSLPRWQARKNLALGDVWYLQSVKEKQGQFLARLEESLWELFPAVVCAAFSCKYTHEKFPWEPQGKYANSRPLLPHRKKQDNWGWAPQALFFLWLTVLPLSVMLCWTETFWSKNSSVLDRATLAVMQHYDPKQVGEERIYLAYNYRAGTWRWSLTQRHKGMLLIGLLPIACSTCFVI